MSELDLPAQRSLRVVLVEDSPLDAALIEERLTELGQPIELTRVETEAALRDALGHGADLVLSDYNVPGFDGVEAMHVARSLAPDVPFLFVTGALGEVRAIELLKQGATDYVLKDRLERLTPSVSRALREAREIRERKAAELRLLERERTLSNLMHNLPGMVFRAQPREPGLFEFASEGCVTLTGYEPETFCVGGTRSWRSIIHADDVESATRIADIALAERRQVSTYYRVVRRDGTLLWVWQRAVGHFDAAGALLYVEGLVTDYTLQKEAEREAEQRAQFEQQLIGIVSHDLRSPLNTIMLGAGSLLKRDLDEQSTSLVRRILRSSERAARMIRDLLDFTQVRATGGIPISVRNACLQEIAEGVIDEMAQTHPTRTVLLRSEGDTLGDWDPDRIAQAISNLVANALAYSPHDTPVTLTLTGERDLISFAVHNHGSTIPDELRAKLFLPFVRGQRVGASARSVGLGLYIVNNVVQAHGGHVDVTSAPEEGTAFILRLPRRASETPRP